MNASNPENTRSDAAERPISLHCFENVEFDELEAELRVAGVAVPLEPRPLRLLCELLGRVNEVLTKDELLQAVWDGRPTVEHVIANAVSKLRAALGPAAAARLVTLPRVGYRLQGPVQRVEQRLQHYRQAPGTPVPGRADLVLERPLGRTVDGGVWLARHKKLGHVRVFKFAEDGARLASLKREYTLYRLLRQELGQREDIASVAEANFLRAPYFLECEYGGPNLLEWAAQDGQLAQLALAQRLSLFLQISRAVAAAHSVGVLHKDLKPANVLMGGEAGAWQPRLTDFGSGRLLQPERLADLKLTALGLTVDDAALGASSSGTPMYLAPELLAGEAASTQSDVYALGLMLFQFIVGDLSRPLSTGWQRQIADDLLIADIAAATEGRPDERLGSVSELIERVGRLDERGKSAAKAALQAAAAASTLAQLQRTRARRPWVVALVSALAIGLGSSLWFERSARQALGHAQSEAARATAINDFLNQDVLMASDATRAGPNRALRPADLLSQASERASVRFKDQPLAQAAVRMTLGELYLKLGAVVEAEKQFRSSLTLYESVQAVSGGAARGRLLAKYSLARALIGLSRAEAANAMLNSATDDAQSGVVLIDDHVQLAEAKAKTLFHAHRMNFGEAREQAERSVRLAEKMNPDNAADRFLLRRALSEIQFRAGRFDDLEANLRVTLSPPFTPETVGEVAFARARINWARLQAHRGKLPEAQETLDEVKATLVNVLGEQDPTVGLVHEELAYVMQEQGKLQQAAAAFQAAARVQSKTVGPDNPQTRLLVLSAQIAQSYVKDPARALGALNGERPWFVANMEGIRGPVVQLLDYHRARLLLDLSKPEQARNVLMSLDAEKLTLADPSPLWPARLQALNARHAVVNGNRSEGMNRLKEALQQMERLGASRWELSQHGRHLEPGPLRLTAAAGS